MIPTSFPSLEAYLAEVGKGLGQLPAMRRRRFLKELEGHLLDEADARGVEDDAGFRRMLAEKERPQDLAGELSGGDVGDTGHRALTTMLGGALIGLATGGHLYFTGWRWSICLAFGLAHGLAVGAGLFWMRRAWQRLGEKGRVVASVALSALLSIPLGFTSTRGFVLSRLFYGAYTGFVLERHAQRRPVWQSLVEVSVFTVFVFLAESLLLERFPLSRVTPWMVAMEWSFNATLHLGVLGAMWLRRTLAARWVLAPQGQN